VDAVVPLLALIIFFHFSGHRVAVLVAGFCRTSASFGLHLVTLLAGDRLSAFLAGQ
jgi:hypothetical protein